MDYTYFDKYLNSDLDLSNCISNHKDKTFVFREEINGQIYYIKKYIPYGKRKVRIALGILDDRTVHYKKISNRLIKLGIPHVKLEYSKIEKKSFFNRSSILVTKHGGEPFESYLKNYKNNEMLIKLYYEYFLKLVKNKIYPIDYNTNGFLVSDKGIQLIDFDDYRINTFLTKKLKKRLVNNLRRIYLEKKRENGLKKN